MRKPQDNGSGITGDIIRFPVRVLISPPEKRGRDGNEKRDSKDARISTILTASSQTQNKERV